ncbi:MAG: helix-turn-helix domain-containing protein, partial [Fimbriimonadaceae bacterium]
HGVQEGTEDAAALGAGDRLHEEEVVVLEPERVRALVGRLKQADRAVELRVRVAQFWCSPCGRGFTPPVPELVEGAHATERFLARAAELIRHGDVTRAAQFLRVPEKTLERWYYAWVERQRDTTPAAPITRIGIDELSLKKSTGSSSR